MQTVLLKIALILGVEVYAPYKYYGHIAPDPETGKYENSIASSGP